MMPESQLPLQSQINWQKQQKKQFYEVSRGLFGPTSQQPYELLAGKHNGLSLSQTIGRKVQASSTSVTIFDVGCGKGQYLKACRQEWRERIVLLGTNSYPYHLDDTEGEQEIQRLHIDISIENAEELSIENRVDVLTAIHVLRYVYDPLNVLLRMYNALAPEGVGFVHALSLYFQEEKEYKMLQDYLKCRYAFEFIDENTVTFHKTSDTLELHVQHKGTQELGSIFQSVQVMYALI